MPLRKDALYGVARMIQAIEVLAADFAPEGLTTLGKLSINKSSRNTIPGMTLLTCRGFARRRWCLSRVSVG
jgi:N-carbamoyl-L-amino-acid hydrolase